MTLHSTDSGLVYTASSGHSVTEFEAAITSYLAAGANTMALLDALREKDPVMPMALCFRGYLLKLAAHPGFADQLKEVLAEAKHAVDGSVGTEREKAHVEALRLWTEDRGDSALQILEEVLEKHPLDMLALRIAHYLHFYSGRGERMRDSITRVMSSWHEDHPHYGYLLGMHAFGLEESGDYEAAERQGREAVARNKADIWAAHAVTHVLQMKRRHDEGIEWLGSLRRRWRNTNNFRNHLIWHEALHQLGLGDAAQALSIYDSALADSLADDFYLDICNNASLLWRLEFAGVNVGERWQALAAISAPHAQDRELAFASLHYLIPLVVTDSDEAGDLMITMSQWAKSGGEQAKVCAGVGLALARAISQSQIAPKLCVKLLSANKPLTFQIGGSAAQRDLFDLLAADCARRGEMSDGS